MFNNPPKKCPGCGEQNTMVKTRQQRTKFSVSKAVIGTCIAGPLGLVVGGCIGNKRITYQCAACGYEQEPDTII